MARPTKYDETAHPAMAEALAKLGATVPEMAKAFKVAASTVNLWMAEHPKFSEAVKTGRDFFDSGQVENALRRRALGYSHPETKVFVNQGETIREEVEKHYPPETAACIFWLKNRQPERWRDKVDHGLEGPDGGPVSPVLIVQTGGGG